jgi:uncharacterized membrane protein YGL010W
MGCKITHLFGVPMIALSLLIFFFDRKKAVMLFSFGWFLQFLGHYLFEHNKPILFTRGRSPYTLLSALVFVGEEWVDTVRSIRTDLAESSNGKGIHLIQ